MSVVITFGYSKEKKGQTSFVYPETNKPFPPKVHFLPPVTPVFKTKMCLTSLLPLLLSKRINGWRSLVCGEFCCDDRLLWWAGRSVFVLIVKTKSFVDYIPFHSFERWWSLCYPVLGRHDFQLFYTTLYIRYSLRDGSCQLIGSYDHFGKRKII